MKAKPGRSAGNGLCTASAAAWGLHRKAGFSAAERWAILAKSAAGTALDSAALAHGTVSLFKQRVVRARSRAGAPSRLRHSLGGSSAQNVNRFPSVGLRILLRVCTRLCVTPATESSSWARVVEVIELILQTYKQVS